MESYKRYFQPKDFKIDWPNIPEAEVSYRRPPLTPEAAEEILGTRKPLESGKRLSKAASFLFGAVAAVALVPLEWQGLNRIFPIKTQPRISSSEGATRSRPTAPRQQERASEGSYDVNTGGFDEIGINNEEFSRDFMALMRPILPAGSYAIRYIDTPGDVIPDDYFGRSRRRHGEQAREDGYNRVLPNGERDIRVFKNGLEDDYGRFANVYELMRVLIHELIHSRESEELNYFVQRVKSQDRIRFPYPEEFLEARAEGKPVKWEDMANEYRSEFIMTILSLREIQPGENWEDVAVTAIMRRFHGSSEVAIRADIETIKAWNPSVNWPDMIRRYHRMVRKFSQQFEIRYFARHLCEPMHDPQLTYVLTDILRRTTAPEALIPSLETENHDTSISELAWSIDNDVSRYQSDRLRKLVLEAEAVSPHARRIVREWEELVDKVDHANQSYIGFGYLGTQDQESTRQEEFTRQARSINQRFARQWRGLSVSERQALRPILIEMARFQAGNFPLPEELSRRVHALTSQRSQNL